MISQRKIVAVTGSSGFVARHLIPEIQRHGDLVRGLDIRSPANNLPFSFDHADGDIRDAGRVKEFLQSAGTLIHLAAEHKDFGVSAEQYESVNVGGMRTLLDAAQQTGLRDIVFYSSVAVYGDSEQPTHESCVPDPNSLYGKSKLSAEQLVREWVERDATRRALILRPTVIFGEHNFANMFRLIHQIARGRFYQIGKGTNRKSTIYVGNAVDATLFLMDLLGPGCHYFNLADEPAIRSSEIANTIADELGVTLRGLRIPLQLAVTLAAPLDWYAAATGQDIPITGARIKKYSTDTIHSGVRLLETGFQPKFAYHESLQQTVRWYKAAVG